MDRKRKRTLLRIGLLLFLLMLSLPAGGFQKASAAETPFSLPIRGAAVYPVRAVSLNGRTLKAGTAMVALKESGSRVQVSFQSETGWIGRNLLAVNLPDVYLNRAGVCRLCVIHRNVPRMLTRILDFVSDKNINVEHMINKNRGKYAVTILDLGSAIYEETVNGIWEMDEVVRVRVI